MPTFSVTTLGCKVNQCESETLAADLISAGWQPARDTQPADLCIINSCTVTHKASMQSRQAVRQAIRANPAARIVVTGCYAQTEPDEINHIKGVHAIVGHGAKHRIVELVQSREKNASAPAICIRPDIFKEKGLQIAATTLAGSRTRAFLKIQDGCSAFCTYCIVPYARGPGRSLPPEKVLQNFHKLTTAGYCEIVLTGIHLGSYGLDLQPPGNLYQMLRRLDDSNYAARVRLSSIEPPELTNDILSLVSQSAFFCRHFHIPLQSGDDRILERMHRPYTATLFANRINSIKRIMPDAAVGVDILVGFPGESETAFENTYGLIEALPVSYLHVFPFSPRPGTPAATYSGRVATDIIKKRCRRMRNLGDKKRIAFYRNQIGRRLDVLIESTWRAAGGYVRGTSANYVPVLLPGEGLYKNKRVRATIRDLNTENLLTGTVCQPAESNTI